MPATFVANRSLEYFSVVLFIYCTTKVKLLNSSNNWRVQFFSSYIAPDKNSENSNLTLLASFNEEVSFSSLSLDW